MHRPPYDDPAPGRWFRRQQCLEEAVAAVRQRGKVAVDVAMGPSQPRLDRPGRRHWREAPLERIGRDDNLQEVSRLKGARRPDLLAALVNWREPVETLLDAAVADVEVELLQLARDGAHLTVTYDPSIDL